MQSNLGGPIVDGLNLAGGILQALSWMLPAAAVLVFFWLVITFIFRKMQGDGSKANPKSMLWGLVALLAIFGVYGLIKLLGSVVGINPDNNSTLNAPQLPTQR